MEVLPYPIEVMKSALMVTATTTTMTSTATAAATATQLPPPFDYSSPAHFLYNNYTGSSKKCGGGITREYHETFQQFNYWCEGILTAAVGVVGFVGNLFSILVLSNR